MNGRESKKTALIGCLCALGCETLYGLSYVFTKLAISAGAETASLLAWRFFTGFAVMSVCAAAGLMRVNPGGRSLRPLLLVALCYPVVYFIAETVGIRLTTARWAAGSVHSLACSSRFSALLVSPIPEA